MTKAIVSLSGGMDSATVLAACVEQNGKDVQTYGFFYNSKHNKYENKAARDVADYYHLPFTLIDLSAVSLHLQSHLLLDGGKIPEGHYEAENMKQTVVPGRNIIFCSILAGITMSQQAGEIWFGVHAGDRAIYSDCRPDFVSAMQRAIQIGTDSQITLETPFLFQKKRDILLYGFSKGVPYYLTRTCYCNQPISCGRCGSCQERLEAFKLLGKEDPLPYVSREIMPKENTNA